MNKKMKTVSAAVLAAFIVITGIFTYKYIKKFSEKKILLQDIEDEDRRVKYIAGIKEFEVPDVKIGDTYKSAEREEKKWSEKFIVTEDSEDLKKLEIKTEDNKIFKTYAADDKVVKLEYEFPYNENKMNELIKKFNIEYGEPEGCQFEYKKENQTVFQSYTWKKEDTLIIIKQNYDGLKIILSMEDKIYLES